VAAGSEEHLKVVFTVFPAFKLSGEKGCFTHTINPNIEQFDILSGNFPQIPQFPENLDGINQKSRILQP
jgi:hypothetical protein